MKILFVCKGNVGRSQIAEALFNKLSKGHKAISAGTVAKSDGQKMIERAPVNVKLMKEIGIDISNKKVKKLDRKMVASADKVIVFCDRRTWPDYLRKSNKVKSWKSKDTKYMTFKERRNFRSETRKKIQNLLKGLEKR